MKGLLRKDYYLIQSVLYIMLLVLAVIGISMSYLTTPWVLTVISTIVLGMITTTTINIDRSSGWRKVSAVLPVSKQTLIDSKYLLYLIFSVLGFAVGVAISLIICAVKPDLMPADEMVRLYLSIAAAMALFSGGVQLPGNFLLSDEKAMITLIVAYPLLTGIFVAVARLTEDTILTCNIVLVLAVVVFAASWLISRKLIAARDIQ